MKAIKVTSIQRGCVYDGPGVRTTVFLKGCVLSCPWCCNPECILVDDQYYNIESKCLFNRGIVSLLCGSCKKTGGGNNIEFCPFGVYEPVGESYSKEQLLDTIMKDVALYHASNGGVTFSGGEPFLYIDELLPVVKILYHNKVSVFFESSLLVNYEKILDVFPYISGIYVDLKLQKELNLLYDELYNDIISDIQLKCHTKVCYRLVFIDTMIDYVNEISSFLKKHHIGVVEIIRCHNLAKSKYEYLGMSFVDYSASLDLYNNFIEIVSSYNIKCNRLEI